MNTILAIRIFGIVLALGCSTTLCFMFRGE